MLCYAMLCYAQTAWNCFYFIENYIGLMFDFGQITAINDNGKWSISSPSHKFLVAKISIVKSHLGFIVKKMTDIIPDDLDEFLMP